MWKCLNCGAMNDQNFCVVCGMKRTENVQSPMQYANNQQVPEMAEPYAETPAYPEPTDAAYSAPVYAAEEPIQKTSPAVKILIICLIVLLMLSCFIVTFLLVARPGEGGTGSKPEEKNPAKQTEETQTETNQKEALFYADYDAFVEKARKELQIPASANISWQVEDPYLWDAADVEVVPVTFYEDGEVVASAHCDIETGEPARSILMYQKPNKNGIDTENVSYITYHNYYGDFMLDIPTFLERESSDSTAAYYVSADGRVTMDIKSWPAGDVFNSVDELYDHVKSGIIYEINYDRKKDNWFVLSGDDSDVVYYQYHIYTTDGLECSYILTYPKELEEEFDDIVTHIYNSFEFE